ncbi:MAG: Gfo/Idh/MocA family oxidoreductase, partial [Verrucomicrobia bacterium]|nr:Gfo/Idh/MocA family oxidoreductase [Verrucomicrobiota bacterium]
MNPDASKASSPLRLGIIGCGNVLGAYQMVIDRLRARGAVEVILACGREAQRSSARSLLQTARFTTDARDVIEADDLDAVIILTSMSEHARWAQAALEAGKHVLVEKPFATTLTEANNLIALSERTGRLLICAPF